MRQGAVLFYLSFLSQNLGITLSGALVNVDWEGVWMLTEAGDTGSQSLFWGPEPLWF